MAAYKKQPGPQYLIDFLPHYTFQQLKQLAPLSANDGKLRSLWLLAGEQTIVVPKESLAAFRRNLQKLGYGVSV